MEGKMMKKTFIAPEISVCKFSTEDIITESAAATAVDAVKATLSKDVSATYSANWDIME